MPPRIHPAQDIIWFSRWRPLHDMRIPYCLEEFEAAKSPIFEAAGRGEVYSLPYRLWRGLLHAQSFKTAAPVCP
jgi:hypothetical protein